MSDKYSRPVSYCRPFDPLTKEVSIYISNSNPSTNKGYQTGSIDHPYTNIAYAFAEAFSFNPIFSQFALSYKIMLSKGTHKVYSGRIPLYIYNLNVTIEPINEDSYPTLDFSVSGDEEVLDAYYPILGNAISPLAYIYANIPESKIQLIFHSLYTTSYLTLYQASVTFSGVNIV